MKKLLIPVIALLLLGGGGAFFFLGGGSKTPDGADDHGKAAEIEHRIYMQLDPITATIFRDQQPAGVFTAALTLEIANEDVRTDIFQARRRLRDAMFQELHAMFEREEHTGRKVNVDAVKRRMLLVANRELGEGMVVDVLVETLMRKGA